MKLGKIIIIILSVFIVSCSNNSEKKEEWSKITRESKKINNITYYFSSEIDILRRNYAIKECQNSIIENLKLIKETEFTNEMDIEFVESRKEMLKYTGMGAQGMAFPKRNTLFTLLKDEGSPIKHEVMHMITMYKWGIPSESSTWMNEGLATYAGGSCPGFSLSESYKYFIQSKKVISMKNLAINFYGNPEMIAYTQSAFVCKFLIDNYGLGKFKLLWKNGFNELQSIYGFNNQELEMSLLEFITKKYSTEIEFNWNKFNEGC
ncbi:peptidase MA superfamily protein [Lutibacter sp. Hel_I_33_5]|uniref:peptidase MA family metallohydrolase n=1 Tax=Lutibacter sp. Hel_I_33_5 TaxID=1566289 RepID=UPI00119F68FA|nr:peptidase MA family metallohydrolase [Lutibacter sp. Hel_I_33_5]TVZ54913.1 peptidase MA superfamily protein [Lutibacter sp. Hel_I_33_5]